MDTARARRLIAALEAAPDEKFDIRYFFTQDGDATRHMGSWVVPQHSCGTAACIAGWCQWVATVEEIDAIVRQQVPDSDTAGVERWGAFLAAHWLGISMADASELFAPSGYARLGNQVYSRARSIAVLRRLVHQEEDPDTAWIDVQWHNYNQRGEYCGLESSRLPIDRMEGDSV